MGWLEWLKGSKRDPDDLAPGDGISLRLSEAVEIGYVSDLEQLFGALSGIPDGSMIYLEGTSAADVLAWLERASVPGETLVTRGTAWPATANHHVPATTENLIALAGFAVRHAEPELCGHLVVYRGEQVLVSAYDAGFDTVFAHRDLPESVLDQLREIADPDR